MYISNFEENREDLSECQGKHCTPERLHWALKHCVSMRKDMSVSPSLHISVSYAFWHHTPFQFTADTAMVFSGSSEATVGVSDVENGSKYAQRLRAANAAQRFPAGRALPPLPSITFPRCLSPPRPSNASCTPSRGFLRPSRASETFTDALVCHPGANASGLRDVPPRNADASRLLACTSNEVLGTIWSGRRGGTRHRGT